MVKGREGGERGGEEGGKGRLAALKIVLGEFASIP